MTEELRLKKAEGLYLELSWKAKLFAQYLNQEVLVVEGFRNSQPQKLISSFLDTNWFQPTIYLLLKDTRHIQDEDVIEYAKRYKIHDTIDNIRNRHLSKVHLTIVYQFLQSKGYALNWQTLTVNEQIKLGWLKLVQHQVG